MYKIMNGIKIITAIVLLLFWVALVACWLDIVINAGPNPTFADWNILAEIIKNA